MAILLEKKVDGGKGNLRMTGRNATEIATEKSESQPAPAAQKALKKRVI